MQLIKTLVFWFRIHFQLWNTWKSVKIELRFIERDFEISKKQLERIRLYALMGVLFGKNYASFLSLKADENLTKLLIYQGAITPLFDDFYDEYDFNAEQIRSLMEIDNDVDFKDVRVDIFRNILKRIYLLKNDMQPLLKAATVVVQQQEQSRNQKTLKLSFDQLIEITHKKGGASFFFIRAMLPTAITKAEEQMIDQLGFVLQIQNDLFDIYKDLMEQNQTLFTGVNVDLVKLYELFTIEKEIFKNLLSKMDIPQNKRDQFWLQMTFIFSKAEIAFEQLMSLNPSSNSSWSARDYDRNSIVVDLERWTNQWKSFKWLLQ